MVDPLSGCPYNKDLAILGSMFGPLLFKGIWEIWAYYTVIISSVLAHKTIEELHRPHDESNSGHLQRHLELSKFPVPSSKHPTQTPQVPAACPSTFRPISRNIDRSLTPYTLDPNQSSFQTGPQSGLHSSFQKGQPWVLVLWIWLWLLLFLCLWRMDLENPKALEYEVCGLVFQGEALQSS